jgi:hypothetical protein
VEVSGPIVAVVNSGGEWQGCSCGLIVEVNGSVVVHRGGKWQ